MRLIPEEIDKFLNSEYGVSLLIKGPPGSGKTTFSLQILDKMKSYKNTIYVSTRIGDISLYNQFPWLKNLEKNIKLIILSKTFVEKINKNIKENEIKYIAKEMLTEMRNNEKHVSRFMYNKLFKDNFIPEIERIYDEVESNLPKQSIIVIDSIEGITIPYGIDSSNFMYMIQKDIIESAGSTVIFVSEKNSIEPEDYIADGVIYMDYEYLQDYNNIMLRYIKIKKLRGYKIKENTYIFTLENGKIGIFNYPELRKFKSGKFNVIKNNAKYSTGIKDLDNILNGGIKPGNILTMNVSNNTTFSNFWLINKPLILNALYNKFCIVFLAISSHTFTNPIESICQDVGYDVCDSKVRFVNYFQYTYLKKGLIEDILVDRDSIALNDFKVLSEINKISENKYPILFYLDYPSLENIKGYMEAKKELNYIINYIRGSNKHIGVIYTNENVDVENEIKSLSNYYINIVTIKGNTFIFGIKPEFHLHGVMPDESLGEPNVKLIQVL